MKKLKSTHLFFFFFFVALILILSSQSLSKSFINSEISSKNFYHIQNELIVNEISTLSSHQPLWSFLMGNDDATRVAISASGQFIIAVMDDYLSFPTDFYKICLFDNMGFLKYIYYTPEPIAEIDISSNGDYFVAGLWDGDVYLYENGYSLPIRNYSTGYGLESISISADGHYFAVGGRDNRTYLFNSSSSLPMWSYDTGDWIYSVAISKDGQYVVAGSVDCKVYLFNQSGYIWSYQAISSIFTVDISADGQYSIANSGSHTFLFHNSSSSPQRDYDAGAWHLAISADGQYFFGGSSSGEVYLFNKNYSTPVWSHTTGTEVYSVAISSDGKYSVSGSIDGKGTVYVFDRDNSTPLWSYNTGAAQVHSVDISADGQYIVAVTSLGYIHCFHITEQLHPILKLIFLNLVSRQLTLPNYFWIIVIIIFGVSLFLAIIIPLIILHKRKLTSLYH